MKVLFVGVGSIGKRHIRDFYAECTSNGVTPEIHVLRRKVGNIGDEEQFISKQITSIADNDYDVVFITNPTYLHYDALLKLKGRTKWYFVEKPIFESVNYDINNLGIDDSNTYVAAPMRHTLLYSKLKEIVCSNKIYSARVICSSYLPDWRPGVDYRKIYSAHKEMGGGANIDLIHEIDYVYDLFGIPESVMSVSGKYSDLEISSDDLSVFIIKYKDCICEIHLDYFGRKPIRCCEIYTHKGTFIADFIKEKLIYPDGTELDCYVKKDEEFKNEMHYFYKFINGEERSINPPSLALETLRIATEGEI